MTHPTITLNNGLAMPRLGLGVWQASEGPETENAVACALAAGYRLIDTATIYRNEASVGRGIRASGIPREDIFVTTKLWNRDARENRARDACLESLDRLGLDYLDLYLLHWPVPGKFLAAWEVLEQLHAEGLLRAIGLSNFLVHHLDELLPRVQTTPAVNQIEFHPRLQSPALVRRCRDLGIVVEAWSPIMRGKVDEVPEIVEIAQRLGKTPVQITLRWQIQRGIVTIPKSVHPERIRANADIFDFELAEADMARLDSLDTNLRLGPDPDNFNF